MFSFIHERLERQCPFCDSRHLRRTQRHGFLQKMFYPLIGGYPYHCGACKKDFILYCGRGVE